MSQRNTIRTGVLGILLVGFVLGYIVACSSNERAKSVAANQDADPSTGASSLDGHDQSEAAAASTNKPKITSTGKLPDPNIYFPGTEPLAPDEMRIVACGTGMPTARAS